MLRLKAELKVDSKAELAEGPQLFPSGEIYWVDIPKGSIYSLSSGNSHQVAQFPFEVAKLLPDLSGSLALCRTGVRALGPKFQHLGALDFIDQQSNLRLSDGAVLADGSIAVGILDRDLAPGKGSLVQITPKLEIIEVVSEATIPNGLSLLPGNNRLVWVDSPNQRLELLDFTQSRLQKPQEFIALPTDIGVPDGLCVDSQGGVWIAMWGGGRVIRVSNTGEVTAEIEVGCPHVTSCCFDANNDLIITTASVLLSSAELEQFPGAGGIWRVLASQHGQQGMKIQKANLAQLFE